MATAELTRRIPFFQISYGKREVEEALRVIQRGYLTQGVETERLEEEFKHYVGSRFAVAVDSCTNGLFLSLKAAGVSEGDIVRIPSLTFTSVANVVLQCGAKIDWEDENHVGFAYKLKTDKQPHVVDSAHQIDWGIYRDFKGSLMCFSFYPTKQISSAEGGMICTDNYDVMEWLSKARWHGRKGVGFNYSVEFPGWKMNMTDLQAILARIQLEKLDRMNRQRKHIINYYNRELNEHCDSLHLYTIDVVNRDEFVKFMSDRGVNCSVHFYNPLHLQPAYKQFFKPLPNTEAKAKVTVSLPLYADLQKEDIDYVCKFVKAWREISG